MNKQKKTKTLSEKLLLVFDVLLVSFLVFNAVTRPYLIRNAFHIIQAYVLDTPVSVNCEMRNKQACEVLINSQEFKDVLDDYTEEQLKDLHIYVVDDVTKYGEGLENAAAFQRGFDIYFDYDELFYEDYSLATIMHHELAHYLFQNLPFSVRQTIKGDFNEANLLPNSYVSWYAETSVYEDIAETWSICHYIETNVDYEFIEDYEAVSIKYNILKEYFK